MAELDIGKAGEYLVCFDLTVKGYNCFPSEQGLPFDLVLVKDEKLVKIQVKTCLKSRIRERNNICVYNIRHGKNGGRGMYSKDSVDIVAFVNLETKEIAYMNVEDCKSIIEIYPHYEKGETFNEKLELSINLALKELHNSEIRDIHRIREIADVYNVSEHTLIKYRHSKKYKNKMKVSFFDDYNIENCFK